MTIIQVIARKAKGVCDLSRAFDCKNKRLLGKGWAADLGSAIIGSILNSLNYGDIDALSDKTKGKTLPFNVIGVNDL